MCVCAHGVKKACVCVCVRARAIFHRKQKLSFFSRKLNSGGGQKHDFGFQKPGFLIQEIDESPPLPSQYLGAGTDWHGLARTGADWGGKSTRSTRLPLLSLRSSLEFDHTRRQRSADIILIMG